MAPEHQWYEWQSRTKKKHEQPSLAYLYTSALIAIKEYDTELNTTEAIRSEFVQILILPVIYSL